MSLGIFFCEKARDKFWNFEIDLGNFLAKMCEDLFFRDQHHIEENFVVEKLLVVAKTKDKAFQKLGIFAHFKLAIVQNVHFKIYYKQKPN